MMWNSKAERVFQPVFFLVVVVSCIENATSLFPGCFPGTHRVISYNDTLVPPAGVRASSQDTVFNTDDNLFHRNNIPLRLWCTKSYHEAMRDGEDNPLNFSDSNTTVIYVNFSEPLLVTHLVTSGFSNGYVNNFSIAYSLDSREPLVPYKESEAFIAHQIDSIFTLEPPLVAMRVMFNIHGGLMTPSGRLCWHLTFLGCTLREAVSALNQTTSYPTTSKDLDLSATSTQQEFKCPTEGPTAPMTRREDVSTSINRGKNDEMTFTSEHLLLLVVLTAAVTVLLVLCVVVTGVCICLRYGKCRREGNGFSTEAMADAGMVDNALYKSRSSIFPMTINCTETLTESENNSRLGLHDNEAIYENCSYSDPFTSYNENRFYESINSVSLNEEQEDKREAMEQSVKSMVDNPNYSVPFPLSYHPLDASLQTMPAPPLVSVTSLVGASTIDMVENECYSIPSYNADQDLSCKMEEVSIKQPSDYETLK